jgi:hypothetical protein
MISLISKTRPPGKDPRTIKRLRILHYKLREPMLTVLLAIQIISLFIVPSVRAAGIPVPQTAVFSVLLVFVTLAIVLARSRNAMLTMIASVILTAIGIIWRQEQPDFLTDAVSTAGQVLTQLSLLWVVSSAVFGRGRTTHHRILGGVVMYLGIGMIFTSVYILLARSIPGAITNLPKDNIGMREALTYYSFGTLTTGTFGDIAPVHPIARSLANMESICGQLFPATLLARIVSLHSFSKTS